MNYKIFTLKDSLQWGEYIKKLPIDQQDVYYTPEYYSLYENYGDGEALCFVYEEGENIVLYPFLKNNINKLGYKLDKEYYDIQGAYGYNGIVTSSKDEKFIERFHNEFTQFCEENNIIAEFTRFHPLLKNHLLENEYKQIYLDRKTVYIDLSYRDESYYYFLPKDVKKHIRRAQKENVMVKLVNAPLEFQQIFQDIYTTNMENVNSSNYLYFNREFFQELFRLKNLDLFIAYVGEKPIACYSCFYSTKFYHTFLSASLSEYNKIGVNPLLYLTLIDMAKRRYCAYVHLGGGTNGDISNSLFRFKSNYSDKTSEFFIGKRVLNTDIYSDIVKQWKNNYPESYEKNKVKLLGYREI